MYTAMVIELKTNKDIFPKLRSCKHITEIEILKLASRRF